ncbi:hypothetical protein HOP50_09g55020 [Chloropicon primus]|uniref:GPR180/TMEM145 transmembrane domain-containing protein n=2 Tax=Chloropicon primus TaxID=1764295 RepID=A0A5B8MQY2_9CHLO|nr:hypothetical protein A3770_09p54770 [Chloropicon primus]UPR02176.1 hypothetical protein HOP50_09g55020 [Chloropicon primus]|eukprot:QDZ22959.1 hypothetical protein A3770_09p54770 [Chloropicon primus]
MAVAKVVALVVVVVAALASSSKDHACEAKKVHGELQLSSINTERYLTKFAADGDAELKVRAKFEARGGFWEKKHQVELDIFTEDGFRTFKQKLDKGSLCDDRVKHAHKREPVAPRLRSEEKKGSSVAISLDWKNEKKSQVLYIYVTDCALEWYNAKGLPPLLYDLEIVTEHLGHLPSDEWGLLTFNLLTSLVLSALFVLLIRKCFEVYQKQKQIHAFILVVVAAYFLQILSLVCETLHLIVFNYNGHGLRWRYTFFALDFVSEIAQGASEHLISLLLIFLACGWTTKSFDDVVQSVTKSSGGKGSGDSIMGALNALMRNPRVKRLVKSMARQLSSPVRSIFSQVSLGGVFVAGLTVINLALEMMGRQYHDEFSQFHDHEHWPGKCILVLRVILWVMFIAGAAMSYSGCEKGGELSTSILSIALFGSIWLLAFPFSVLVADRLAPRLRHRFVSIASVVLQMIALQYLCYLCFFAKSFKKISSIADPRKAQTLPSDSTRSDGPGKPQKVRRRSFKVAYD